MSNTHEDLTAGVRRCRDNLYYSGRAVLWFGIWNMVKVALQIYFNKGWSSQIIDEEAFQALSEFIDPESLLIIMEEIMFLIFAGTDMLIRAFIAVNAMKAGKGKKHKKAYVVVAALYVALSVGAYIYSMFYYINNVEEAGSTSMVSLIIEITSLFAMVMIIVSASKLKGLKKRIDTF